MNYKKILLLVASVFIIVVFYYPVNSDPSDFNNYNWLENKILNFFGMAENANEWDAFQFQLDHLGIEERRAARLGGTYSFCQNLKKFFAEQKIKDPLVLLPTQEYIKAKNIEILIPEPIVFYYECGLKGAQITSANVDKCNWAIVPDGKGGLVPVAITSKEQLQSIITEFRKYNP